MKGTKQRKNRRIENERRKMGGIICRTKNVGKNKCRKKSMKREEKEGWDN